MNSKEENHLKKIGEKLKKLRESKGLEQKGFAFDCEIGRTQHYMIKKWQNQSSSSNPNENSREFRSNSQ